LFVGAGESCWVIDAFTGQTGSRYNCRFGAINSIAVCGITNCLFVASGFVGQMFELGSGKSLRSVAGHTGIITSIRYLGGVLYTAGDSNVVAWDAYPLLTVAMEGNLRLLRFLLNGGTNIETRSDMGNTAMLYAAQFGHVDLVHELIQRGSDVYLTNVHDGETILHKASCSGSLATVRVCLDAGIDPNSATPSLLLKEYAYGKTGRKPVLAPPPARTSTRSKHIPSCPDRLHRLGSLTPLHIAAWYGYPDICIELLRRGASPDWQSDGLKTPLMLAAWRKNHRCVEALIAFQANPNLKDMHDFTAIGHSHKEDRMGVKLLWKWKLQHWKNEIRLKKMLRSMTRLNRKSSLSPSTSPTHSPHHSPHTSPRHSPQNSPRHSIASSPRRISQVGRGGVESVAQCYFDVPRVKRSLFIIY
jgi:hypothetical protein